MFQFLITILMFLLSPLPRQKRDIITIALVLKAENSILHRTLKTRRKRPFLSWLEKLFYAICNNLSSSIKKWFNLVTPETVLKWQKQLIKSFWTFSSKRNTGRPAVSTKIKNVVLEMKNSSLLWGAKRIQGELLKLGIELSIPTIRRIIQTFRKQGRIKNTLGWKQFIQNHIDTLFAMDFFTLDTIFGKRFYIFFLMEIKTRKIIQHAITLHPNRQFLKQQIILFETRRNGKTTHLIHDNSGKMRSLDYSQFGIISVPTTPYSPNMNAFAERFVRSIRKEALDWFIIINQKRLRKILDTYITFYNEKRPHQGLLQKIPEKRSPQTFGTIKKQTILAGLQNHYYRGVV